MEENKNTQVSLPENVTEEAIKKFELAVDTLTKMNQDALLLKVDLNDPQTYKSVYDAQQLVKKTDIAIRDKGEELREDAVRTQRQVIAVQKYLSSLIEPAKQHLTSERKKFEEEKERKKKEKEAEEAKALNERVELLAKYGATHDVVELKIMSDIAFENLLEEHKESFELAEAKKKEEEERLAKEAEELRIAQEAAEAKRKELEEREAKIREQELELERAKKEEEDRLVKQREDERAAAEAFIKNRNSARVSRLVSIGMLLDPEDMFFKFGIANIHSEKVRETDDESFEYEFTQLYDVIQIEKEKIEVARVKKAEEAAKAELERIEQEKKAEEDRLAKKEAKRIAKMPDIKRLSEHASEILFNMPMPPVEDMKTEEGIAVWNHWKKRSQEFQSEILEYIKENL